MTLATLGPVSSNFVVTGFALCAVFAFVIGAVLWKREGQLDDHDDELARHDEQLATLAYQMPALLDWLGVEIPAPAEDDSPEALAEEPSEPADHLELDTDGASGVAPDDCPTDEFPALPATVPDGIAIQVQSALIEQRPSPVPRNLADEFPAPDDSDGVKAKRAAWVDEQIARFQYTGRDR